MINPYAIIGGLLLLIAVALGGMQAGRKMERATWQEKALITAEENRKALAKAHDEANQKELLNQAKARKATENHVQALNDLNQKYAHALDVVQSHGLRVSRSICDGTTATNQAASASGSNDAVSGTVELPAELATHLYAEAKRADELAEQLRGLQGWVKSAGFYGEPP